MDKILSVAMQCNSRLKLKALITTCVTLVVTVIIISLVGIKVLNTVIVYKEMTVKVNSSSVNVELDLNR